MMYMVTVGEDNNSPTDMFTDATQAKAWFLEARQHYAGVRFWVMYDVTQTIENLWEGKD